jgi:superfamily II DNA or RNA helicase
VISAGSVERRRQRQGLQQELQSLPVATLEVTVGGDLVVRAPRPKLLESLLQNISTPNPEYRSRQRLGLSTRDVPPRISAARQVGNNIVLPRGCVQDLKYISHDCGYEDIKFLDHRSPGELVLFPERSFEPREYQDVGAEKIRKATQGTIVLPCGTGKSLLGVEAIRRIGVTALVIVPTKDIQDQWCEDVRKHLQLEPGTILEGKVKIAPVTIGIIDSIDNKMDVTELDYFGFVVHDECHRSCARKNQRVMSNLRAKYRLGLTATKMREDGLGMLIDWTFGECLLRKSMAYMVSRGFLLAPEIISYETNFNYVHAGLKFREVDQIHQALVDDGERVNLIVSVAKRIIEESETTSLLVLANRIEYCEILCSAMANQGLPAEVVTSHSKKKSRKETIAKFKSGEVRVMLATSLADEGLNVTRLSDIILAFPERARGRTIQRIGRVMRPFEGKYPKLHDIVDSKQPMLASRWEARQRTYKTLGLES